MVLHLAFEETRGGPWRAEPLTAVIEGLVQLGAEHTKDSGGVVLDVDGRSSSGKTTLAARLKEAVAGSAVIHTDDVAWWHSRFGWADVLIDGVLVPFHRGEPVSFRPPLWAEHGRPGSINVPGRCPVLIIEGMGAGRAELSHLIDALVWVQADQQKPNGGAWLASGSPTGRGRSGLPGVDGRGRPVPGRSAALGTGGHPGCRYSPDPVRSSLRTCRRTAAHSAAVADRNRDLARRVVMMAGMARQLPPIEAPLIEADAAHLRRC